LQRVAGLRRPQKGSPVPLASTTSQFNRAPRHVTLALETAAELDLQLWFGGGQSLPGVEEVIGLRRYGKTLTLLSVGCRVETGETAAP